MYETRKNIWLMENKLEFYILLLKRRETLRVNTEVD